MASGQGKSRAFARRCGIKGGAEKLSAEERSETAKRPPRSVGPSRAEHVPTARPRSPSRRWRAGALPGLRQRLGLGLGLRIANGLRQHLLKFGLGLCWFPPLRLKCVHENNMVMRQAELKHLRPRKVTS